MRLLVTFIVMLMPMFVAAESSGASTNRTVPSYSKMFGLGDTGYDSANMIDFDGRCSGSLIKFEGASDQDNGLLLTAGHCVHPMQNAFDKPSDPNLDLRILDHKHVLQRISSERMLVQVMQGTDIAIFRLNATYKELSELYGITPLILASNRPQVGEQSDIVSVGKGGYYCTIDAVLPEVREDKYTLLSPLAPLILPPSTDIHQQRPEATQNEEQRFPSEI